MTCCCSWLFSLFHKKNKKYKVEDKNEEELDYFTLDTLKSLNMNMEYLDKINYDNTTPFVPPITNGKVVKVYDGDTFTIASKLPNTTEPIYRFSVRLNNIDAPEIKGKTANEKELAKKARDALSSLILNKIVTLQNITTEKYGRILADVYVGDINVSDWLVFHNYAVYYDGGTKERPDEWN
jgi:endonuclease YncB( thermonuclease family)